MCENTSLIDQRDCTKINQEVGKSGLSNSANLVEMLWHKIKGGNKNLDYQLQNIS